MNTRILLTGGPGAGKTTVLAGLARRGHITEPEAGRDIIREEVGKGGNALPWQDAAAYAARMLDVSRQGYLAAGSAYPVFFDRGIPDVAGYLRLIGQEPDAALLRELQQAYPYHPTVFLFPPWEEIYANDAERKQDFAEAIRTHDTLSNLYQEWGYTCICVPEVSAGDRVDFILGHLRNEGFQTDTGFSILFLLEGAGVTILEIKRNHPTSTAQKDRCQWLLFDQKSGELMPLSFVSMNEGSAEQSRIFDEGTLRFTTQVGTWETGDTRLSLAVPELFRLSASLRNALQTFLFS